MIIVNELLAGMCAPATIETYTQAWRDYVAFAGDEETALKAASLANWRQYLVTQTKMARSTINKKLFAVKAVVHALRERGLVDQATAWDFREIEGLPGNALTERLRPHARTRISPEDMRRLIDATDDVRPVAVRLFHRALLLVLASSGMRVSEAISIRVENVEERGKGCVITGVLGKNKGEPRDVPISKEACVAIHKWLAQRKTACAYVFNADGAGDRFREFADKHIDRVSAGRVVKRYATAVGLRHVKSHDFRRYTATQLIKKAGIRVAQRQLGHKSIEMTARYEIDDMNMDAVNDIL